MGWEVFIPIIAQYGLPLAQSLYKKWSSGTLPNDADFVELEALTSRTAKDRMKAVLVQQGQSLDDPKSLALLALV